MPSGTWPFGNDISGAPVVTDTGELVGVLSETDLLVRDDAEMEAAVRRAIADYASRGVRVGVTSGV